MNSNLSLSARIHNCAASQEVEFVHATHSFLHASAYSAEEWSSIWSQRDDCSWAHAFGRMRGFRAVWHGSVTLYDAKACLRYNETFEAMPEIGGLDPRPLMEISMHTLATDIVEVADDGLSARATFLTPGQISGSANSRLKRRCGGLWERYGADFVYEDDRWLFLHEHVCPDMGMGCDSGNPGHDAYEKLKNPAPMGGPGGPGGPGGAPGGQGGPGGAPGGGVNTMPDCEDAGPLHSDWTPVQTVQNTVPWPEPYATLDNNNTYTPFLINN